MVTELFDSLPTNNIFPVVIKGSGERVGNCQELLSCQVLKCRCPFAEN
jgi:hypothetical protein